MREQEYKLLPCPFCGKDKAVITDAQEMENCANYDDENKCPAFFPFGKKCSLVKVVCDFTDGGCGASTGYTWNEMEAVISWNHRAEQGDDRK